MVDLASFIEQARSKGLDDDQIRQALTDQGWSEARIAVALRGLEVPSASTDGQAAPSSSPQSHPSLSPLMAALHHVLLWFFTGSSSVTIVGVVASLSGTNVSSRILASMIAVTVVTFIPYATLFLLYLLKVRKIPDYTPNTVWSIITICLHSIAAMTAAITATISLITSGNSPVLTSALLILSLDLAVLITYCFAAFAPMKIVLIKRIVILLYLPLLGLIFGALFIMSLLQLGPAKHDEALRKDLATTVTKINKYAKENGVLPTATAQITTDPDIEYNRKTSSTYEVCAVFKTSSQDSNYGSDYPYHESTRDDSYVYDTYFFPQTSGRSCFTFSSSPMKEKDSPAPVNLFQGKLNQ